MPVLVTTVGLGLASGCTRPPSSGRAPQPPSNIRPVPPLENTVVLDGPFPTIADSCAGAAARLAQRAREQADADEGPLAIAYECIDGDPFPDALAQYRRGVLSDGSGPWRNARVLTLREVGADPDLPTLGEPCVLAVQTAAGWFTHSDLEFDHCAYVGAIEPSQPVQDGAWGAHWPPACDLAALPPD